MTFSLTTFAPILWGALALVCGVLGGYFSGVFTGALYVPTRSEDVALMLKLAELKAGEKLVDIGSGDGRIVIASAKAGNESWGYEVNPFLVWLSRRAVRKAGLEGRAVILQKNLWNADLSGFQVVAVFGVPQIMTRLRTKLERELAPGTRVLSNLFPILEWEGEKHGSLYVYKRP